MKYKCRLKIKNSIAYRGEFAIYAYCFSWRHGFESFLLEVGDEHKLLNYYNNIDNLINQIKNEILKKRKVVRSDEIKDIIKKIEEKGKKIIIDI